jgi:FkbM family methyltransferase
MLKRLQRSIAFRAKMARFGIFYLRTFSIRSLRIAGNRVPISFPRGEESVLEFELGKILFEDCYHLGRIRGPVKTVLDVGANVGLFSVAARHFFPDAAIHAYEPNATLDPYLKSHCEPLSVRYHLTGIGVSAGRASLTLRENSLHTVLEPGNDGEITLTSFREAIDRLGGSVDVLKLDCEGAEWTLLDDEQSWSRVHNLTMEYHLWAKPHATTNDLIKRLGELGFRCSGLEPSPEGPWGMLQATRDVPAE